MIDPAQIDYTDADYASLRSRLISVATTEIAGWDATSKHPGNLLLEAIAWAFDITARYQDVQALEAFLATARRRENVERLAAMIGYSPTGRVAALYEVTVTLAAPPIADVTIPIGHQFRTGGSAARTLEAITTATILAGADPATATVSVEDTTGREDTATSTKLPDQEVTTTGRPLPATLVIVADDGAYTIVDSLAFSGPTDRHVTVRVTDTERVIVHFGNGALGKVPEGAITISYRIGGGTAGNVAAGAINRLDALTDALANPVAATCTNIAGPYVLGRERETIAEIKQNAPASVRVTDRTVTKEDYEVTAEQVSGVARALMLTSNELPRAIPENHGYLYVVPTDLGTPAPATLAAVLERVTTTRPKTITFRPLVQAAVYTDVNLRAVVYFARNVQPSAIRLAIVAALTDHFAPLLADLTRNTDVGFGIDYDTGLPALPLSKILSLVQDVRGVARVGARDDDFLLNNEHADVTLAAYAWPRLGTVTVIDGNTGVQVP